MNLNCYCENCGWSEIVGSPIMCNYSGQRTWRDECCEAWKPKGKETNMVEVVRCKDCIHCERDCFPTHLNWCTLHEFGRDDEYYCADGERKE